MTHWKRGRGQFVKLLILITLGASLILTGCATSSTKKKTATATAAPSQPTKPQATAAPASSSSPQAAAQPGPTSSPTGKSFDAPPSTGAQATCPVSEEPMTVEQDTIRVEHGGRHYVLCCANCKRVFQANPGRFVDASPKSGVKP